MRGAGESLCGIPRVSTNINGAAAFCRPNMPHTLRSRHSAKSSSAAFEPPRPYRLRRGVGRFCGNLALRTFQCSPLRGSAFQCCAYGHVVLDIIDKNGNLFQSYSSDVSFGKAAFNITLPKEVNLIIN